MQKIVNYYYYYYLQINYSEKLTGYLDIINIQLVGVKKHIACVIIIQMQQQKINRNVLCFLLGKDIFNYIFLFLVTGVSYKWYPSVAGLPNLFSVIDGQCTLKVENKFYTENTFYMKQAVHFLCFYYFLIVLKKYDLRNFFFFFF